MASITKEEVYDPAVNYDSASDSGLSDTEDFSDSLEDLSTEFWSGIGAYSGRSVGGRLGGPQADNEGGKKAGSVPNQKIGQCKHPKCKKKNVPLYLGNVYPCHKGTAEQQKRHNGLCYDCASGRNEKISDEVLECFVHRVLADEEEEDPEALMESD